MYLLQVDHDDDNVFALMLLLQPAPYLLEFQKNPDKKPTKQDQQVAYRPPCRVQTTNQNHQVAYRPPYRVKSTKQDHQVGYKLPSRTTRIGYRPPSRTTR